jgi:hypothetical protein
MSSSAFDIAYPVIVTRRANGFELRIEELLLVVCAATLEEGWRQLVESKQQVLDHARAEGLLDEIPSPRRPPPVGPEA